MNMKKILAALSAAVICASAAALPAGADFVTENGKTYYTDDSGKKLTGIQTIDGKKYYFRKDGSMYKGKLTLKNGKVMLFRSSTGEAATGWIKIGDEKYYFDENGYMLTGNQLIGDKIYKFEDTGEFIKQSKNELIEIDGKLYHTEKNGKLSSGITKVKNEYYYFGKNGYAISCTVTEDGYIYEFDCDEGLVSKTETVTDYSEINIKVGPYVDPDTNIYGFRARNNAKGNCMTFSGWLKAPSNSYKTVSVYAELLNKDGDIIDEICIARRAKVSVTSNYHIDDYVYTSEPVYEIKFTSIIVK